MKKEYLNLLGAKVMPLVKRCQYDANNWDRVGNLNYLSGEKRLQYGRRVVDEATKEQRKINKEQDWGVWAIHADGTFTLRSDYGYEQAGVKRNDFRVIDSTVNNWD